MYKKYHRQKAISKKNNWMLAKGWYVIGLKNLPQALVI